LQVGSQITRLALRAGWWLETNTNLSQASGWSVVTNLPVVLNGQNVVANALGQGMLFYRLHKP
jgi:hypothetical protein